MPFVPRLLFHNPAGNPNANPNSDVVGPNAPGPDNPPPRTTPPNRTTQNRSPMRNPLANAPLGSPHRRNNGRGQHARQPHPNNSNLLWCTKQHHWVHSSLFSGEIRQCDNCRIRAQANRARRRAIREAELAAQQLDQMVNPPDPPAGQPEIREESNPPPQLDPPSPTPLSELAVSAEDRVLMQTVRDKIMDISLESCDECHER
ncbi:hypothetical protein R3P38DRAFT_2786451 [Favolaschia claudopus]|uniref:Uncharacterized protein n=1 Tax=Favolaschia claudopus TaxID=2862362 RepID=A0AAW0ARS4_9AGAR